MRQSTYGRLVLQGNAGPVEVSHVVGDLVRADPADDVLVDEGTTRGGGARTGSCAG